MISYNLTTFIIRNHDIILSITFYKFSYCEIICDHINFYQIILINVKLFNIISLIFNLNIRKSMSRSTAVCVNFNFVYQVSDVQTTHKNTKRHHA